MSGRSASRVLLGVLPLAAVGAGLGCAARMLCAVEWTRLGAGAAGPRTAAPLDANAVVKSVAALRMPRPPDPAGATRDRGAPRPREAPPVVRDDVRPEETRSAAAEQRASLERLWREVYAPVNADVWFPKMYGSIPLRPLAGPLADYDDHAVGSDTAPRLAESRPSAYRRLSALNVSAPGPLLGGEYQVLAYQTLSGFESIVGTCNGRVEVSDESLAEEIAAALPVGQPLSEAQVRMVAELARRWCDELDLVRRQFWKLSREWFLERAEFDEPHVVALYSAGDGALHVIRRGEDSDLDRLLFEYEELETSAHADIVKAVRR